MAYEIFADEFRAHTPDLEPWYVGLSDGQIQEQHNIERAEEEHQMAMADAPENLSTVTVDELIGRLKGYEMAVKFLEDRIQLASQELRARQGVESNDLPF